jgi:hypothetical protein
MEVCERNSIVRLVVDVVQRVVSAIDEISWAPLQWISAKQMQGHVPWSISNLSLAITTIDNIDIDEMEMLLMVLK